MCATQTLFAIVQSLTEVPGPFQTDKKVLSEWALNNTEYYNASLVKHFCRYSTELIDLGNNQTQTLTLPEERCECTAGTTTATSG